MNRVLHHAWYSFRDCALTRSWKNLLVIYYDTYDTVMEKADNKELMECISSDSVIYLLSSRVNAVNFGKYFYCQKSSTSLNHCGYHNVTLHFRCGYHNVTLTSTASVWSNSIKEVSSGKVTQIIFPPIFSLSVWIYTKIYTIYYNRCPLGVPTVRYHGTFS